MGAPVFRVVRDRRLARPRPRGRRARGCPALDRAIGGPRRPRLRRVPRAQSRDGADGRDHRDALAPVRGPLAEGVARTRRLARARPRGRGARVARCRLSAAARGRPTARARAVEADAPAPRHAIGQHPRSARTAALRLELRLRRPARAGRRRLRAVHHRRGGTGPRAFRGRVPRGPRAIGPRPPGLALAAGAIAGLFAQRAPEPPLPELPRLRSVQRRQLKASLAWFARMAGLAEPRWLRAVPD